jgi:hypothetical protein
MEGIFVECKVCNLLTNYVEFSQTWKDPIHPATIYFSLASLALANILNILYGAILNHPISLPFVAETENLVTIAILR